MLTAVWRRVASGFTLRVSSVAQTATSAKTEAILCERRKIRLQKNVQRNGGTVIVIHTASGPL